MRKILVTKAKFRNNLLLITSFMAALILYTGIAAGAGEPEPIPVINLLCPTDNLKAKLALPPPIGDLDLRAFLNCTTGLTGGLTVELELLGNSLITNVEGNVRSNLANKHFVQDTEFSNINSLNNFGLHESVELRATPGAGDFPEPAARGTDFMTWQVDFSQRSMGADSNFAAPR